MRKLSIEDFKSIMLAGVWSHDVNVETVDTQHHEEHIYTPDGDIAETRHSEYVHGYGNVVSTCEDITLTYEEQWSFTKYDKDSFDADDGCWTLDGAVVVDEDGDEVAIDWVIEDTDDLDYDFTYIDYSELEITETKDIDVQASDVDRTMTIECDNGPTIRFTGDRIAAAASSDNNASGSSYSGSTGRWTELKLYKTKGGYYVCHQIGYTRWQGERDLYKAKVCETTEEVIEFFGHRWLAKELYENAGIEDVTQID